jgi:hypothetical protein
VQDGNKALTAENQKLTEELALAKSFAAAEKPEAQR